ncbi:YwhD family protein [Paenibacillus herberti]|uniref:YwhD family protein n=1 Tax=Paenibacillus herberti TaxID=1619309 RepID=UPI003CCB79E3
MWIIWVSVDRDDEGSFCAGVTACPMLVDTEVQRGWKILAQHVNNLDYAIKRRFVLDGLPTRKSRHYANCSFPTTVSGGSILPDTGGLAGSINKWCPNSRLQAAACLWDTIFCWICWSKRESGSESQSK